MDEPVSVGPSKQWHGGTDRLVSADHRKGEIIGLGTRGGRPIAKPHNPRKRRFCNLSKVR